jgi:hypothetical protein
MAGDVVHERFVPLEPQDVDLIFLKAKTSTIDKTNAVLYGESLIVHLFV